MTGMPQGPPRMVAVSQRVDVIENRDERRDAVDQRLTGFLVAAGLWPVPVPNQLVQTPGGLEPWLDSIGFSGVVLSGGNNIGDTPERDATESTLLDFAKDRDLPVLGICRGMQMIASWAGGPLVPVSGHVGTRHLVSGQISSEVNSYHDYGLGECPKGFEVTARSGDGVIEAIRHRDRQWQGWMWHPERENEYSPLDIERMVRLFGV